MLHFPFLPAPLSGSPPPTLGVSAVRWRPLLPVRIHGQAGQFRFFPRAVLDTGADDCVFPIDVAAALGIPLSTTGHAMRWRGRSYAIEFGHVELELTDDAGNCNRWQAIVGFSAAPLRYPILGNAGCMQFFDTMFRGDQRVIELEANASFASPTP